jgi:hypothetical protein
VRKETGEEITTLRYLVSPSIKVHCEQTDYKYFPRCVELVPILSVASASIGQSVATGNEIAVSEGGKGAGIEPVVPIPAVSGFVLTQIVDTHTHTHSRADSNHSNAVYYRYLYNIYRTS